MNLFIYFFAGLASFFGVQLIYHLLAGNFVPEAVAVANISGFWSWMNTGTVMLGLIIILLPVILLALLRAANEAERAGRNIQ